MDRFDWHLWQKWFFQVWMSSVVHDRASSMGEQVSIWSHSAACTTIVGSKCMYSHGLIQ